MYIYMRLLNKLVSAADGVLEFTGLNFHGDNIILQGKVLYLRDIHNFIEALAADIKGSIQRDLFFNLDVISVDWSPTGIVHEEPRNLRLSYSAFDDPHNHFLEGKHSLLQLILDHPRLRGLFHFVDQQNRIVWKAGPCFAYMDLAHEVEMKLFCATQTSVGEPGRGTEVASHLIRNVAGGTIRNVLLMFQFFVMMGTFNKTSHLTECEKAIVCVPLPEIGRLWMLYLTFIRPVLIVWQNYFNGPRAAARAKHCLFFGPYRAVTSSELSLALSFHTHRLLGVKIPISLWRHVVTWFVNHNCHQFQAHLTRAGRSVLATQSGHGLRAHGLYAGDSRIPAGIDFHVFFDTMLASGVWHEILGFPPLLLNSMVRQQKGISDSSGTSAFTATKASSVLAEVKDIAAEIASTIIPEFHRMHRQARANDLASFLEATGLDIPTPPSSGTEVLTHIVHPSRLAALRRFMKDDQATFKHPQQALAVELIASGNPSILLIAPTGTSLHC
jgi:hypothetical protein